MPLSVFLYVTPCVGIYVYMYVGIGGVGFLKATHKNKTEFKKQ